MSISPGPPVAAIFNTSPDTVDLLRGVLSRAGFVVVTGFTFDIRDATINIDEFMGQHKPDVIVYDIAPPYEENCRLFVHLRQIPAFERCPVVLTSTNIARVEPLLAKGQ